ncbi:predicted protein [Verticillium alfalfae VaMs.102]|uniref:Predicted protein n=1 Tax=Verticillium alfalfae (strain VaMs.102 / ATCC MYA-4576 / FGSC 10136) TaxID=526221 RepID=C9SQ44_VERA1|nr:predicted protein [Verticillium alfalfae VaMs.102]EEY20969.1 predicted protein [Verticillium alfalfae VaMs.102]
MFGVVEFGEWKLAIDCHMGHRTCEAGLSIVTMDTKPIKVAPLTLASTSFRFNGESEARPPEEGAHTGKSYAAWIDGGVVGTESGLDRADDASRVILFAPGALYEILPLFVAESSDCPRYSPDAVDGGVVAWPISHSRPNLREKKRDIEIVIKAQVLKANEPAAKADADAEPEAKTVTKEEL